MKKDLCKPCMMKLKSEGKIVVPVYGRSEKVTCAECGRRRFGCSYDIAEIAAKTSNKPGKGCI